MKINAKLIKNIGTIERDLFNKIVQRLTKELENIETIYNEEETYSIINNIIGHQLHQSLTFRFFMITQAITGKDKSLYDSFYKVLQNPENNTGTFPKDDEEYAEMIWNRM